MNDTRETSSSLAVSPQHPLIPSPQHPISIRAATMADLPWMDQLQKKFGRALGYFPTKQFEGYIEMGAVLVARASRPCMGETPMPLGYIISRDRYLKRDELGVVYQLCVAPGFQRGLIGATLVREVFQRAAYGCRLFCCWCAQDLAANYFWESLGFVPLAFRAGSGRKKRLHIFWQRRTHAEDVRTPWWYPFQTSSGAIRADRLVFPIPPGVRWQDVRPIEVPTVARASRPCLEAPKSMGGTPMRLKRKRPAAPTNANMVAIIVGGRVKYVPKPGVKIEPEKPVKVKRVRPAKERETLAFDPRFLKQNRELRDRYLERVNGEPMLLGGDRGKYDVSRALLRDVAREVVRTRLIA